MADDWDRWVRWLVDPDPQLCQAAVDALGERPTDPKIAAAVRAPEFPRSEWLPSLARMMIDTRSEYRELSLLERERVDRAQDRALSRLNPESSPATWRTAITRSFRMALGAFDAKNQREQQLGVLMTRLLCASQVAATIGDVWLDAPDALRLLLNHPDHDYTAIGILRAIGPDAAPAFADDLWRRVFGAIEMVVAEVPKDSHQFTDALASVIRDDSARIRRLGATFAALTIESAPSVLQAHLTVLAYLGTRARQENPDLVEALRRFLDTPEPMPVIGVLAAVTARTQIAVDEILERSYSDDIWVKSACLNALGVIACDPERVVPRLIAAFDDYAEPDPDERYHSEHAVVARSLAAFGPDAAPAVPALLDRLLVDDGGGNLYPDRGIALALAAIGPAAASALPVLEPHADPDILNDLVAALNGGADPTGWTSFATEYAIVHLRGLVPPGPLHS